MLEVTTAERALFKVALLPAQSIPLLRCHCEIVRKRRPSANFHTLPGRDGGFSCPPIQIVEISFPLRGRPEKTSGEPGIAPTAPQTFATLPRMPLFYCSQALRQALGGVMIWCCRNAATGRENVDSRLPPDCPAPLAPGRARASDLGAMVAQPPAPQALCTRSTSIPANVAAASLQPSTGPPRRQRFPCRLSSAVFPSGNVSEPLARVRNGASGGPGASPAGRCSELPDRRNTRCRLL